MSFRIKAEKLRRLTRPALHQSHLRALGRDLDVIEIEPPSLEDFVITYPDLRGTTADDVLEELLNLRRRHAAVIDCGGRAARAGDAVVVEIASVTGGQIDASTRRRNVAIPLEPDFPLQELVSVLTGARAGNSYVASVDFPEDFEVEPARGARLTYDIKVKQVVRRELPPVDDRTFLSLVGIEGETGSLVEHLWARVSRRFRQEQAHALIDAGLAELHQRGHVFEVSRDLLDAQLRRKWMLVERPALARWCFPTQETHALFLNWVATSDVSREVEFDLASGYLLEAVADARGFNFDDDASAFILRRAGDWIDDKDGTPIVENVADTRHVARVIAALEQVMGNARFEEPDLFTDAVERTMPGRRSVRDSLDSMG